MGFELPLGLGDGSLQPCRRPSCCSGVGSLSTGAALPLLAVEAALGDVVEEGVELVILALRDRVELVVVALRTADGQPEPDGAGGVHAVDDVGGVVLLGDRPPFVVDHVVAVEPAGDLLREQRARQEVAGELLDR